MQDDFPPRDDAAQRAPNSDASRDAYQDRDRRDPGVEQFASWFLGERTVDVAVDAPADATADVAVDAAAEGEAIELAPPALNEVPDSDGGFNSDSHSEPSVSFDSDPAGNVGGDSSDVSSEVSSYVSPPSPPPSLREFYGLRDEPFGITPDPAYLYASPTHSEALDSLFAGIRENRGFLALIAEPGMGKTTLLFQLLQDLHESARTVFLFQTQCDSQELVRYILHGLDIDTQGMGLVAMHDKLNEVLFQELMAGKRFVLVIDEAQNLDDSVLETVRMLSNYEAHHTKLLQIVLAGQPQLAAKLAQPQLLQLRQRISVLTHLEPLDAAQITSYIAHRLAVAGYSGEPLFQPEAIVRIAERSHGIPRNINNLCYHALLVAHARMSGAITPEIVQEAADRLNLETLIPRRLAVSAGASSARSGADTEFPAPVFSSYAAASHTPANARRGFAFPRWPFRAAALATILIVGSALLVMLERGKQTQASPGDARSSSHAMNSTASGNGASYSGDPQTTGAGQVITVVVRPNQSLIDISMVYVGHYDPDLLVEIRALNPGIDLDHLVPGQLIQIPLPPGTLRKAN